MKDLKGMYKFWAALRTIGRSPKWEKTCDGSNIRLYDKNGHEYCPLTAVNMKLLGEQIDMSDTHVVASNLGMSNHNESNIVDAADYDSPFGETSKRIRRKMKKLLRIKE